MDRRDFLKRALLGTAALGAGLSQPWGMAPARAAHGPVTVPRTLVNLMLFGGADLRYLFVPAPGSAYANLFWQAREGLYVDGAGQPLYSSYQDMWANEYLSTPDPVSGITFGIHKSADWLQQEFVAGNVAIVSNVFGSLNRRHDHSQLIVEAGDANAERNFFNRSGWGGRLAYAASLDANLVPVSSDVPLVFANGIVDGARLERVLHMSNSRNFSLPGPSGSATNQRSILARAGASYYAGRGPEIDIQQPSDWPFRRFFQQEASIRAVGDAFDARLAEVAPTHPAAINALYTGALNSSSFGRQCANLYDCLLAPDILDMRVSYMSYGGWDTHSGQKSRFERNLDDLFGLGGGFDVLNQEMAGISGANDNVAVVFNSDFGRQLVANGDHGTDHGRGNYSIIWSRAVNGGVYGEMFPDREIQPDPSDSQGRAPLEIPGRDILGQSSFEHVLGAASDWMEPGTGDTVFPDRALADLEAGFAPGDLFL